MRSQLTCHWKEPKAASHYRSAVSLHGHTNHSREGLCFIGDYASRNLILRAALATQTRRAQKGVDFKRAYWTPPLSPLSAFQVERNQIEGVLGLAAMVSLTDHDNIEAPVLLRLLPETRNIPISVEWSVPYRDTTLHLGVHNLPGGRSETIMAQLAEYTKDPREQHLRDLMKVLHNIQDVLIVLNHPMWDVAGVGKPRHIRAVHDFVAAVGMFIHAFELGGVRSWEENQAVLDFAERWDQLVIGGGDRHGAEPSAVVNLTNAENFSDFVYEVRDKHQCHALFMPQYSEPFTLRVFQTLLDVVREYPDYPETTRRWDGRVFHPDPDGVMRPLSALWKKPPGFIEAFFSAVRLLEAAPVRRAIRAALAKPQHQMQFVPGRGREVTSIWTSTYGSLTFPTRTTKSMGWRTPAGNLRRSPKGADSPS